MKTRKLGTLAVALIIAGGVSLSGPAWADEIDSLLEKIAKKEDLKKLCKSGESNIRSVVTKYAVEMAQTGKLKDPGTAGAKVGQMMGEKCREG